ncbi:MAG TPA: hypothetical protein VJV79_06340 [Polyangiaceae bacterium]|nr:hypothetical protein [Polyangiaceae bacterium]
MSKPTSISRRMADCIDAFNGNRDEQALIHFFPALDKTAKRRRPRDRVGDRIKRLLGDQEEVISRIATGGMLGKMSVNGVSFPEAIYKFGRNSIAHEGELDRRLKIIEGGSLTIGRVWCLPRSYILALCVGVMIAPENVHEHLDGPGTIPIFGRDWALNDLWGAQTEIVSAMASAMAGAGT